MIEKYEGEAIRLESEIHTHILNDREEKQLPVIISPQYEALMTIKRFQRELLLQLRKRRDSSDTAIREVERDMDIDELKLNQSLPKTE
jgi:CPA1 family monovalent cation:H+ antiporter